MDESEDDVSNRWTFLQNMAFKEHVFENRFAT